MANYKQSTITPRVSNAGVNPDADVASARAAQAAGGASFGVSYESRTAGATADGIRYMGGFLPMTIPMTDLGDDVGRHTTLKSHGYYLPNYRELCAANSRENGMGSRRGWMTMQQNTTLIYIDVGEQLVFCNPNMIDRSYVIDSADYTTGPDADKYERRFRSILTAGPSQWTRQSRALAKAVDSMKMAILAQNNDTNPYFDMPRAEIYDRILDQLLNAARAVALLKNVDVAIGLRRQFEVGARGYFQDVYDALYTADNITKLQSACQQLREALVGAPVLPSMLKDYLEIATIQHAPVQNGSVRLIVPVIGNVHAAYNTNNTTAIADFAAPAGDNAGAFDALPDVHARAVSTNLLTKIRNFIDYFHGSEANIVRTAILGFSCFETLGLMEANEQPVVGSRLVRAMLQRSVYSLTSSRLGPSFLGPDASSQTDRAKIVFSEPCSMPNVPTNNRWHDAGGWIIRPYGFSTRRIGCADSPTSPNKIFSLIQLPVTTTDDPVMPMRMAAVDDNPVVCANMRDGGYGTSASLNAVTAWLDGDQECSMPTTTYMALHTEGGYIAGIDSPMLAVQHNPLIQACLGYVNHGGSYTTPATSAEMIKAYDAILDGAAYECRGVNLLTYSDDTSAKMHSVANVLSPIDTWVEPLQPIAGELGNPVVLGGDWSQPVDTSQATWVSGDDVHHIVTTASWLAGALSETGRVFGRNTLFTMFYAATGVPVSIPIWNTTRDLYGEWPASGEILAASTAPTRGALALSFADGMSFLNNDNLMPTYHAACGVAEASYQRYVGTAHEVTPAGDALN